MKQVRLKRRNRVILTCGVCKKDFETHKYRENTAKYCSKLCWENRGILEKPKCKECGKEIITNRHNRIFCSRECSFKFKVGINATRYKDGKSLLRQRGRDSNELSRWRIGVFKRDNYSCKHCGCKKELQAHHIKSYADYELLRFDINNGITLCIDCHGKVHNKDFHKKNKICLDCGKKVKMVNTRCHVCSTKEQWRKRKCG